MTRLIAFLLVLVPILLAVYGVAIMRDALFGKLSEFYPSATVQFIVGLISFIIGLVIVGGFIYRRDQKRKKVVRRFGKRRRKQS
jgi:hypothetical protein